MDYIRIVFTEDDVDDIAEANDIPTDVARARAENWGKSIGDMASRLCAEQLESCIVHNSP